MCVLVGTEHAQNIVIFMHWLIEVFPLLLVPPIAVGISKLTLLPRRIDVAAILGCLSVLDVL